MVTVMARPRPLERALIRAADTIPTDGHVSTTAPDLCFYRYSGPTTFTKGAAFGVTMGVVLQGAKRIRVGDHELTVDPQRLLVLTRDTEVTAAVTTASPDRPYLGLHLCFSPEKVAGALLALAEAGATAETETVPAFLTPIDPPIADAIDRLIATLADPLDRRVLAPLVTDEILYRLLRSDAAAAVRAAVGPAADARRILASMQFIRAHHPKKLSVEHLARQAAMSPSHFAHRFRAVARISPMRYLREVRLERARSLLLASDARASNVGVQVGFESAAHFTREFKRRFGAPPSHYLRQRTAPPADHLPPAPPRRRSASPA